jgi:hypothetical protein
MVLAVFPEKSYFTAFFIDIKCTVSYMLLLYGAVITLVSFVSKEFALSTVIWSMFVSILSAFLAWAAGGSQEMIAKYITLDFFSIFIGYLPSNSLREQGLLACLIAMATSSLVLYFTFTNLVNDCGLM